MVLGELSSSVSHCPVHLLFHQSSGSLPGDGNNEAHLIEGLTWGVNMGHKRGRPPAWHPHSGGERGYLISKGDEERQESEGQEADMLAD